MFLPREQSGNCLLFDKFNDIFYEFNAEPNTQLVQMWDGLTFDQRLIVSRLTFRNYKITKHHDMANSNFDEDEKYNLDDTLQRCWFAPADAEIVPSLGGQAFDGHTFIAGATGSGKSWFAKEMLLYDTKRRPIYLMTDLENEDVSLRRLMARGRLHKFSEWEGQSNSICLFDDVHNKEVLDQRDIILEQGRHHGIVAVVVTHQLRDWKATKVPLLDSRWIVMFPLSNRELVNDFLYRVAGLPVYKRNVLLNLVDLKKRHLFVHKFSPNLIGTGSFVYRV